MATYVFQNCFSVRLFLLSNLYMKRILPLLYALAFLSPAGAHAGQDEESEGPARPKAGKAKTAAIPETPGKTVRLTLNDCINRAVRNSRQLAAERHRLAPVSCLDHLVAETLQNVLKSGAGRSRLCMLS